MLTTITTSSQALSAILTAAQITQISPSSYTSSLYSDGVYKLIIQNLGAQDIYVEFGGAATTTGWIKITTDNSFTFTDVSLSRTYLISASANNTNVRISAN